MSFFCWEVKAIFLSFVNVAGKSFEINFTQKHIAEIQSNECWFIGFEDNFLKLSPILWLGFHYMYIKLHLLVIKWMSITSSALKVFGNFASSSGHQLQLITDWLTHFHYSPLGFSEQWTLVTDGRKYLLVSTTIPVH